ncbi:trigger factor [Tautonia sociabilis]|uniref:Trigger factor n=1 Tax=Tautonia sociabilis TaxID=2080755 RepID=A0A432MGQ7_9BACT|nr:trigger factor [Tautonia sociabilis]RUL86100.1 trigger factor [Tautonia sociabilis]
MSTGENERDEPQTDDSAATVAGDEGPSSDEKRRLNLEVQITDAGPCKKHVKIVVPRSDIDQQFEESLGNLHKEALIPGFRPGRAPRELIQRRYRKELAGQVKSALVMACMEQLDEEHKLNPISQPDFDFEALELPEDGPLEIQLDVEVQPDFEVPEYKNLVVKRPVRKITDADVDQQYRSFLERYAQLVPKLEGGAEVGDYVVADLTFSLDGKPLNLVNEVQFRLQKQLRFQDGLVPDMASALTGARPGESRTTKAQIGSSSPDPSLRGREIDLTIQVHDLKTLRLPETDAAFFEGIGFDDEQDLKNALRSVLERRVEFQARQAVRRQIVDQLIERAPFELPADLVKRQELSTLRRLVNEMREAGYTDSELRAREAEIRANAHEVTLRNLKEFFLLSKIAEREQIKVEEDDLAEEIELIAIRTDETPRRVRSRLQKEGQMENLATQILERKAIDRILDYITVELEEVATPEEEPAADTLDQTASGTSAGEEDGREPPSTSSEQE